MELRKILLIAFVFSGIAALIYQITWIRPLQFLLGSTVYTISIIFSAFMAGLALGSGIISKYVEDIKNLPQAYGLMEIGIGLYGVLLLSIFNLLPKIYNSLYGLHTNFYLFEVVQFLLVFIVLLIPTTLMGATFPVIVKHYTEKRIGKAIGEVYAANNLGAILGSFAAGFILIPLLGIKGSIIFAGSINMIIGSLIVLKSNRVRMNNKLIVGVSIFLFIALALVGNYNIQQMHSGGFYRTKEIYENLGPVVYYEEGLYATVTVRELVGQNKALFINGIGQGSSSIADLRVNFLLSYLPLLINSEIENVLIIGLGTGTTSGQISQLTKVTTIEIESKVLDTTPYFKIFNLDVLVNSNHSLIIDDGRNYLIKNNEKYDLIISEPTNTWQSFSTQIYSKEFLELVKEDLSEDGLYALWVPIYDFKPQDFKNLYKTFNSVFPNTIAFANIKPIENTPVTFETSEIILIGSKKEIELNEEIINKNYDLLPEISKQYLDAIRLSSGNEIYNLLLFTDEQIKNYADDAKLITDDKPLLEFSTARNVYTQNPDLVIKEINKFLGKSEKNAD